MAATTHLGLIATAIAAQSSAAGEGARDMASTGAVHAPAPAAVCSEQQFAP